MRRRTRGQSMVEMAFVAPILFIILFAIIDMSWYIYGYMTVYQAARNAAQVAASLPPSRSSIDPAINPIPDINEKCVQSILVEAGKGAVMFPDLAQPYQNRNFIKIRYPDTDVNGKPARLRGSPIEVSISYPIKPLTPFWNFITFGTQGTMQVRVTARRSIENLADSPASDTGIICEPD